MRLIDADALIKKARGKSGYDDAGHYWMQYKVVDVKTIEDAPTVDPVKHGRFIPDDNSHGHFAKCSVCGTFDVYEPYEYCPWCGTKMDLEVSECD